MRKFVHFTLLGLAVLVLSTVSCSVKLAEPEMQTLTGASGYSLSFDSNRLSNRVDETNEIVLAYLQAKNTELPPVLLINSKKMDTGLDGRDLLEDAIKKMKKMGGTDVTGPKSIENPSCEVDFIDWKLEDGESSSAGRLYLAYNPTSGLKVSMLAVCSLEEKADLDKIFNPVAESLVMPK